MRYVGTAILATITGATLLTVGCTQDTRSQVPAPSLPASCTAMLGVPAYSIAWEDGSKSRIQSGSTQVREAVKSSEGNQTHLKSQCDMIVKQFKGDLAMLNR